MNLPLVSKAIASISKARVNILPAIRVHRFFFSPGQLPAIKMTLASSGTAMWALLLMFVVCDAFTMQKMLLRPPTGSLHLARSSAGRSSSARSVGAKMMIEPGSSPDTAAMLLAFADQGSNLAGKFFQGSLLPYIGFLYFLNNNQKQTPKLAYFGFQFLLLFVFVTIPTGIISKSIYGVSLADADWLHGAAESLLTVTNLLIVTGFRSRAQRCSVLCLCLDTMLRCSTPRSPSQPLAPVPIPASRPCTWSRQIIPTDSKR